MRAMFSRFLSHFFGLVQTISFHDGHRVGFEGVYPQPDCLSVHVCMM